ncbi:MAG: ATP-dependent helicase [bacterium]
MDYFLSDSQLKAVTTTEGSVLVFAGAGSGKTGVITHRIAYLIDKKNVDPSSILAVTFTNKAAKEMRERVSKLLGANESTLGLTLCTFHSLGFRILKSEYKKTGYPADFTVYSPYEQSELMKKVMTEENISSERFSPRSLLSAVSKMKNDPILINDPSFLLSSIVNSTAKKIMNTYSRMLKASGAMDFDDLILLTTELLKNDSEVLEKYSNKFRYIMIDEYQDTNKVQFELIRLLSSKHKNIFVVGDDDQSIYSWRGAEIENILNFEKDFKNSKVIKLEENYRSIDEIVNAAGKLIANNKTRAAKSSYTSKTAFGDDGIAVENLLDETDEAEFVSKTIKNWQAAGEHYKNIAVIVRANHQSKFFEIAFNRHAIPFSIIGGEKFFENKEIKDIVAYIRVIVNPLDEISLRRIINYPARGIGVATLEKFFENAATLKINPGLFLKEFKSYVSLFKKEQLNALNKFVNIYRELSEKIEKFEPVAFAKELISLSNIENEIKRTAENETVAKIKLENVRAFIDAVATAPDRANFKTAKEFFSNFINSITLLQNGEEETKNNTVTIITAHSAKGLEFNKVFIAGFYQGGIPNHIAIEENNIEEERRLCYVAMTRAKTKLVITIPSSISFRGVAKKVEPSMFLNEAGLDEEKYTGKPPDDDLVRILEEILKKIRND